MKQGGGFAAAVLVIMFSEQAFLNAGPLITRGLQGAAAAGFIFNVLMIARAPLQLFQAVSTSILPHLTSLHTSTDPDSEREFHRSVRGVLLGVAAFAAFTGLVVLIAGPQLMQLAFSDKFSYDRAGLLLIDAGDGALPGLGHAQPGLPGAGPGAARRRPLARLRRLLHRLELPAAGRRTSSAASRSASRSPPASSSSCSTWSTAARTNGPRTCPRRARRRSSRRGWRRLTRTSKRRGASYAHRQIDHLGSEDGRPRCRADPDRRRPAGRRHRRGAAGGSGADSRPAALPRPGDAGRLRGHRRDRLRRRRAGPDPGHDRAGPDPLRGRPDRRLVGDPAGARHRRLAGDDGHARHRR